MVAGVGYWGVGAHDAGHVVGCMVHQVLENMVNVLDGDIEGFFLGK